MEWTPINKVWPDRGELPDNFIDVLISMEDEVYMAFRHYDWWFVYGVGRDYDIEAADAWMEKPKPYKG